MATFSPLSRVPFRQSVCQNNSSPRPMFRAWRLGCRLTPVFACCASRPAQTDQACSNNLERCPRPLHAAYALPLCTACALLLTVQTRSHCLTLNCPFPRLPLHCPCPELFILRAVWSGLPQPLSTIRTTGTPSTCQWRCRPKWVFCWSIWELLTAPTIGLCGNC